MKISQLVKELNSLKKKHGDLNVRFDASCLDKSDLDLETCVRPLVVNGIFKVNYEDLARGRKEVLLIDANSESSAFDLKDRRIV